VHCDNGCSIYTERPTECRDFQCAWMLGDMADNMRPDVAGFMVEQLPEPSVVFVTPLNRNSLITHETVFNEYLAKGVSVVASNGFCLIATGASHATIKSAINSAAKEMGVIK